MNDTRGGIRVLGVHLRGTDKRLRAVIPPAQYYPLIDSFLAHHPRRGRILLATEDGKFRSVLLHRYGSVVMEAGHKVAASAWLGTHSGAEGWQRGSEVLLDTLLLAKCDFLLKSASAVSEFALAYNPDLIFNSVDFNFRHHQRPPWAAERKAHLSQQLSRDLPRPEVSGVVSRPWAVGARPPRCAPGNRVHRISALSDRRGILLLVPEVSSLPRARVVLHNVRTIDADACVVFSRVPCGADSRLQFVFERIRNDCDVIQAARGSKLSFVDLLKHTPQIHIERFMYVFLLREEVQLAGFFDLRWLACTMAVNRLNAAAPSARGVTYESMPSAASSDANAAVRDRIGRLVDHVDTFALMLDRSAYACVHDIMGWSSHQVFVGRACSAPFELGGDRKFRIGIIDALAATYQPAGLQPHNTTKALAHPLAVELRIPNFTADGRELDALFAPPIPAGSVDTHDQHTPAQQRQTGEEAPFRCLLVHT